MKKRKLIMGHGDKGGIGKSTNLNALIDYLLTRAGVNRLVVVDADTRNPDVSRMYPDIACQINLRTHDGWNELFDLIEKEQEADIVVNLPGGIGEEITKELESLKMILADNSMELVVFFNIDRLPDTVNLLKLAVKDLLPITKSNFIVVKNLFSSPMDKFEEFDESDVAKVLATGKCKVIKMPEIQHPVKKTLSGSFHGENKEQPVRITELLATNPKASIRIDLQKWMNAMFSQYDDIFTIAAAPKAAGKGDAK